VVAHGSEVAYAWFLDGTRTGCGLMQPRRAAPIARRLAQREQNTLADTFTRARHRAMWLPNTRSGARFDYRVLFHCLVRARLKYQPAPAP
jgi:hypothetical protein